MLDYLPNSFLKRSLSTQNPVISTQGERTDPFNQKNKKKTRRSFKNHNILWLCVSVLKCPFCSLIPRTQKNTENALSKNPKKRHEKKKAKHMLRFFVLIFAKIIDSNNKSLMIFCASLEQIFFAFKMHIFVRRLKSNFQHVASLLRASVVWKRRKIGTGSHSQVSV